MKSATEDLFRLTGSSIPVASPEPEPAPKAPAPSEPEVPEALSSARKPEASIMFSLEALMKANPPAPAKREDAADDQLWSMQSATPLFGTAHDEALLTTPLKPEQTSTPDSMILPAEPTGGRPRRWSVLAGGSAAVVALAAAAFWLVSAPEGPAEPAVLMAPEAERAALVASPPSEAADAPSAPSAPVAEAPTPAPAVNDVVPTATATAPVEAAAPVTTAVAAAGEAAAAVAAPEEAEAKASDASARAPSSARGKKEARAKAKKAANPAAIGNLADKMAPFDTGAARNALNDAASKAEGCRQGGGPTGKGKVQLTFATTGKVSSASIVDGPLAGTSVGNCALRYFRAARVPGFSGSPQTVSKSFKIP